MASQLHLADDLLSSEFTSPRILPRDSEPSEVSKIGPNLHPRQSVAPISPNGSPTDSQWSSPANPERLETPEPVSSPNTPSGNTNCNPKGTCSGSRKGKQEQNILRGLRLPNNIASLKDDELTQLAEEVRELIISTVSRNGGHLAPSLGVVELTLALLKSFDFLRDRLIWDVGHQSYAYKILTGRAENFSTLRKFKGLSGFPKLSESPYDHFGVGHSSTSISAALGFAMARDLANNGAEDDHHVVSVIGDGALTAGLALEGLNQAGHMGKRMIVVLNDNEMSISKNVGALSLFLSRGLSTSWARRIKDDIRQALGAIPGIGEDLLNFAIKSQHGLKSVFTPGMLFEALNFKYVGPVDGHNIKALCEVLGVVKGVRQPVLMHVLTKKGKGYTPAEVDPCHFHGVGKFQREEIKIEAVAEVSTDVFTGETFTGETSVAKNFVASKVINFGIPSPAHDSDIEALHNQPQDEVPPPESTPLDLGEAENSRALSLSTAPSYTEIFSQTLLRLAEQDQRIIGITAAMPEGVGLSAFAEAFPERFIDVGICEQHAVTFAAGLAVRGLRPVVAVYSTFLQRAYDQIVHDVCIQNLPVTFCLDRAGLVGEDGPTHHGVFDLSYLRHIPNLTLLAPKDEAELQQALCFALQHDGPVALRYPRGKGVGAPLHENPIPLPWGVEALLQAENKTSAQGHAANPSLATPSLAILAVGNMVHPALKAAQQVRAESGLSVGVYNVRWVKPLPKADLLAIAREHDKLLLLEENSLLGGFSSSVLELLADNNALSGKQIQRMGIKDEFIEHGGVGQLRSMLGLDVEALVETIKELVSQ